MKHQPNNSEFLTVDEVAKLLRVTRETIILRINEGALRAFRVGRQWRISEAAFVEFTSEE